MKRNTSRRTAAMVAGIGMTSLALVLSGCSAWAPQTAAQPYVPSDGAAAEIGRQEYGGVKLRNFLMVSNGKGTPGVLVGAVVNEGTAPVTVNLQVGSSGEGGGLLGEQSVTVRPGELVKVGAGDGGPAVRVASVPAAPGALLTLRADTPQGGAVMQLPVLAPVGPYASLSPSANPSPTADSSSPQPSGSPSASASPTG